MAGIERTVTVRRMPYPSDLTDDQWELLEPVFNAPGKRDRKHADDLARVLEQGRGAQAVARMDTWWATSA